MRNLLNLVPNALVANKFFHYVVWPKDAITFEVSYPMPFCEKCRELKNAGKEGRGKGLGHWFGLFIKWGHQDRIKVSLTSGPSWSHW